jgi:hypothetical protein
MNRQECEYLIGCLLEDIRKVVKMYDESIDHVSMSVTDKASRAFSSKDCDGDGTEYLLKVDIELEGDNDDTDC